MSEIGIAYRDSALATEGEPALPAGPRAGDRLPDAPVRVSGRASTLQREVVGAHFTLLVCTRDERHAVPEGLDDAGGRRARLGDLLHVRRLVSSAASTSSVEDLIAEGGVAFERLGVRDSAVYLVRPDGYVAYRCSGTALGGVDRWIEEALGA